MLHVFIKIALKTCKKYVFAHLSLNIFLFTIKIKNYSQFFPFFTLKMIFLNLIFLFFFFYFTKNNNFMHLISF